MTMAIRASKLMKAFVCATLALLLSIVSIVPTQAFAAPQEPYTYTVRLFAGAQGTFTDGTDRLVYDNLKPGTILGFHQGDVVLDNEQKYYVRGWKVSGRDNDTSSELLAALTVSKDLDLVVSYGILGENVGYTVRYVDTTGAELYPTEHFYGNIGESPMLAYRYIEGFTPQAYNLTGELLADESKNVYTFTYTPLPAPEEITVVVPVEEGAAPAPAAAAPAAGGAAGGAAAAPATAVEPAVTDITDEPTPAAAPATIQDIRDEENPLAKGVEDDGMFATRDVNEEASLAGAPIAVGIIGLVILAAAIVGLILFLRKRKKDRQAAMQEARSELFMDGQGAAAIAQPNYVQPFSDSGIFPGQQ